MCKLYLPGNINTATLGFDNYTVDNQAFGEFFFLTRLCCRCVWRIEHTCCAVWRQEIRRCGQRRPEYRSEYFCRNEFLAYNKSAGFPIRDLTVESIRQVDRDVFGGIVASASAIQLAFMYNIYSLKMDNVC